MNNLRSAPAPADPAAISADDDPVGAFCRHVTLRLPGNPAGPLAGLTFAAKDIYDIAGHVTGCGNPDWLASHPPAPRTATAVQDLLDAGATLVGKTLTDELAFSLHGENAHYGTPVNSAAPDRVPGGSSNGSAAAVAAGLVDLALGSDTGGSVRAPASYCGLFGIRPSHGAIPLAGAMPLAPSFDTVGWFTRSADLLTRVGNALLPADAADWRPSRVLFLEPAFALANDTARAPLHRAAETLGAAIGPTAAWVPDPPDLTRWLTPFQALQWREIWQSHRDWITATRPHFGPGIAERFAAVAGVTDDQVAEARAFRLAAGGRLLAALGGDGVLITPTVPGPAPLKGLPRQAVAAERQRALALLCPAGLARLPQVSLPVGRVDGAPVGLSLIGPPGSDRRLLALTCAIAGDLPALNTPPV